MRSVEGVADDRSARARIRDTAMTRFATDGFQRSTIRAIAADAGVSPALVLHHFGSKDGLRSACDDHVINLVMTRIEPWLIEPELHLDRTGALSHLFADSSDVIGYVGRAMVEGGDRTDVLVDRFIDLTEDLLARAEKHGKLRPTRDPRARAAIAVLWDMVTIVLGRHLSRALGETDPQAVLRRYGDFATEIYAHGMLRPEVAGLPDQDT